MAQEAPFSTSEQRADLLQEQPLVGNSGHEDDEVSVLDLVIVLAERKRLILWTTASAAVLAAIISLILPVRYTATVTLMPPQQNGSLSAQLSASLGSLGSVAALAGGGGSSLLKNPNDMYAGLLKSRTVEDAMIEHFGLMQEYDKKYLSEARKKFESYATIDSSGKDGLIHISIEDHDPRRASELANGYVDQFRELSQHLAFTEADQRTRFFDDQLKQANRNLANAEESLKQTQQQTGVIQLDSQARALIESAASLRAQIVAKGVQIQGMQTYAAGENAQLVQAQQELDGLRTQLTKLGGGSGDSSGMFVPKGQMTEAGLEYVRKLRDVKYYETIFEILARQFELAQLDRAKEGALIQVVDPAIVPDRRTFPKRTMMVIAAAFVGLLVGIFAALCQAALVRMREDPEISSKFRFLRHAFSMRKSQG